MIVIIDQTNKEQGYGLDVEYYNDIKLVKSVDGYSVVISSVTLASNSELCIVSGLDKGTAIMRYAQLAPLVVDKDLHTVSICDN